MEKKPMHDKKIDELLTGYANGLGRFEGVVPEPRRARGSFWRPLAVTAGVAVVAVLIFAPRPAEAAPLEKVVAALGKVDYWRAETWTKSAAVDGGREWRHKTVQTYWNGVAQFVSPYNTTSSMTTTVKGNWEYYDFEKAPYVLKFAFDRAEYSASIEDPMKHALSVATSRAKYLKRADEPAFEGREAYSLTIEEKGKTHFKAIIAKDSNLPLSVLVTLGDRGEYQYKTTYAYDAPGGGGLSVDSSKRLIDVAKVMAEQKKIWSGVPVAKGRPTIYEATVGRDGSVWVAHSSGVLESLKGGAFVRGSSYRLGSSRKASTKFLVNGKEAMVTRFLPLSEAPASPKVQVQFRSGGSATVSLRRNEWDVPTYLPAFVGYQDPTMEEVNKLATVALHWARVKDYKRAVVVFDRYFAALEGVGGHDRAAGTHFGFRAGRGVYEQAAVCYEKAGDSARAAELRKMAGALRG